MVPSQCSIDSTKTNKERPSPLQHILSVNEGETMTSHCVEPTYSVKVKHTGIPTYACIDCIERQIKDVQLQRQCQEVKKSVEELKNRLKSYKID